MYVRIARFEGAEDSWDERIGEIRERMKAGKEAADGPPITRSMMLVDRESGRGAGVQFCETEEDLRTVDEYMNSMSPPSGSGTRSSVEMFEVALDSEEL
ncbi:MAG: hypothetical protein ACR2G9_09410 [Gaiellaceae bacterium]